jgi:hypothetical protein
MKSFLNEITKKFEALEEIVDDTNIESEEEIEEQNVASAVAGYNTPNAFTSTKSFKKKKFKYESVNTPPSYTWESYHDPESTEEDQSDKYFSSGDNIKWKREQTKYPGVDEIMDQKYLELIESYKTFNKTEPNISPSKKVNNTIREIAKKLQEIETLVKYNSKLKTESGVNSSHYGVSTNKALTKISERLIKISERVRSFGE